MRGKRKGKLAAAKSKAKAAWSYKVRERALFRCEKCGTTASVQAHHHIPSTWERYRFDLRNGVSLCYRHHIHWAHKDTTAYTDWLYALRPSDVPYFKQKRQTLTQNRTEADYIALIEELGPETNAMEDAA